MSKLNPNAQKWVDALRSGKYKQGRQCLRRGDDFCCLGVGCEVAMDNGVPIRKTQDGELYRYGGRASAMPDSAYRWYGLRPGQEQDQLIRLNDVHRNSFTEIADYIEEHAEELGVSA